MPDREKVIRAVETCFDSWIDRHQDKGLDLHEVERLKSEALELLKEQEPVEAHYSAGLCVEDGCFVCGNCDEIVCWVDNGGISRYKYCPNCGRQLKWDKVALASICGYFAEEMEDK